ncbi:thiamine pyrophosphate-binding protein [Salibacterium aidingense]|uniref:thiamine pyrophosphate-binding protein n=1 Tax=Salibacterium aidingense TaxID=384933 RepID=UPI003BC0B292
MKQGKVAEFVAEFLSKQGVRNVYGIPGGQPLTICDAIYDRDDIDFIATRHENGAAHAADATGRLTGIPGVCLATTGPGATNLITGVGGAYRDSSPVIVITANNNRKDMLHDDAQDADHIALFESLVKWSVQISHPDHVVKILNEAFHIATNGNPGPVHLDFTRDVLSEMLEWTEPIQKKENVNKILGDVTALKQLKDKLLSVKKPVIWAGNGVKLSKSGEQVLRLSEKLNIPVVTTFNGIGGVDMTHDHVFGPRSRSGSRLADEIFEEADLLLALGNSLNGPSTSRWNMTLPGEIYQIDIDSDMLGRHYPQTKGIWGDVDVCLAYLLKELDNDAPNSADWLTACKEKREKWLAEYVTPFKDDDEEFVKPQTLMQALHEVSTDDAIFSVDAGNPGIWSHLLPVKRNQAYMKPVGFGNMAFALPGAIASKKEAPGRQVLCVVGDGSLGMSLGELETAVREKTNIIIVLMNDRSYGNIKQEQLRDFGPRYIGVEFIDVDFTGVVKAMGGEGERVTRVSEFKEAFVRAQKAEGIYIIDTLINPDISVWTKPF